MAEKHKTSKKYGMKVGKYGENNLKNTRGATKITFDTNSYYAQRKVRWRRGATKIDSHLTLISKRVGMHQSHI